MYGEQRFSEKLIELYKAAGKRDAYAREVSYQVLHFHQSDLRYIYMLKQLTAAEEWESVRETLLCAKTVKGQVKQGLCLLNDQDMAQDMIEKQKENVDPDTASGICDFIYKKIQQEKEETNESGI